MTTNAKLQAIKTQADALNMIALPNVEGELRALSRGPLPGPQPENAARAEGRSRVLGSAKIKRMAARFDNAKVIGATWAQRVDQLANRPYQNEVDNKAALQSHWDGFATSLRQELEAFNADEAAVREGFVRGDPHPTPISNLEALVVVAEMATAPLLTLPQLCARAQAAALSGNLALARAFRDVMVARRETDTGAGLHRVQLASAITMLETVLLSADGFASEFAERLLAQARQDWSFLVGNLIGTGGTWDEAMHKAVGSLLFPAIVNGEVAGFEDETA